MTEICSNEHNSLLRRTHTEIKNFKWEAVSNEFHQMLPTLFLLMKQLLPKSDEKFLSFIIALIIKKRCKHMSLVQRIVSVMFYGNATNKQVSICII